MTDIPIPRELAERAASALEDSVDMVRNDYATNWRHGVPTRAAQLESLRRSVEAHESALAALRSALTQQAEPATLASLLAAEIECQVYEEHVYPALKRLQIDAMTPGGRTPWLPYLSDRADGVRGHYAIARWNPRGFREVWNLRGHGWAAFSDDVLTLDEAHALLNTMEPATPPSPSAEPAHPGTLFGPYCRHLRLNGDGKKCVDCGVWVVEGTTPLPERHEARMAEAAAYKPGERDAQPSGEVLTDVRAHITAAMDNDLGWADRMLQMDKARKIIDATLAKIGGKR